MAKSFASDFKQFFGRGLAILLPSIVTLWLLWQALAFVYANVAEPINRGVRVMVIWSAPRFIDEADPPDWFVVTDDQIRARLEQRGELPSDANERAAAIEANRAVIRQNIRRERLRAFWNEHWYLNVTGFVVAILLIYLAGLLLGNYIGRRVYARVERLIARIPGFKQVYPHVKQVVDLILGEKKMAFSKVVLVQWPRQGVWSIAFLTGNSVREIDKAAGGHVVSVFIPNSPTPFTGFTMNVRKNEVIEMDMSVEEALRFIITAGVLSPDSDKPIPGSGVAAALAEEARDARDEPGPGNA